MHTLIGKRIIMLRPAEIRSSVFAARRHFDSYELQRLADSISANGIIEPLLVRKSAGRYELISGERRLRAARMAGLRRVPCVIHRLDNPLCAVYAILENVQRKPLDPFEEAEAIEYLTKRFRLSQTEIASRLGISVGNLSDKLLLLQFSKELKERIGKEELTPKQILSVLRLPDTARMAMIDRMTDATIPEIPPPEKETVAEEISEPVRKSAISDPRIFANSLYRLVDITQNAGINITVRKSESEKYVEYRVKIHKESYKNGCHQLKICRPVLSPLDRRRFL